MPVCAVDIIAASRLFSMPEKTGTLVFVHMHNAGANGHFHSQWEPHGFAREYFR